MKDFQLAWKNLWRNRRRTLITSASVFFAIFFSLVMRSFQLGAYDRLFKNVIESYTGYLELQHTDYLDDPSLDNSFEIDQQLIGLIKKDPNVNDVVPRLESFALAASGSHTQGVMVLGIDPIREDKILSLSRKMVKFKLTGPAVDSLKTEPVPDRTKKLLDLFKGEAYTSDVMLKLDLGIKDEDTASLMPVMRKYASFRNSYLREEDTGNIVIGDGLSSYLKAGVGDTVVLVGQGYHGASAAGKFIVGGIIKLPAPDIDNIIVYMPLEAARELYAAPGMATSAVLNLKSNDDDDVSQTRDRIDKIITDPLSVRTWQELNALMVNQMEADNRSGMIMIAVLYLVIAFGVFGTALMMLAERKREFGMLVSIGMKKSRLARVVSMEMLFTGLLGVVAGVIASIPVVVYGHVHPLRFTGEFAKMYEDYGFEAIMPTMLPDTFYLWQIVVVLIILLIAVAFSTRKIFRLNVINALRA